MGFQKFTTSEESQVLSPEQHRAVEDELRKVGKTNAQNLTDEERKNLSQALDKTE